MGVAGTKARAWAGLACCAILALSMTGCMSFQVPKPDELVSPQPVPDNSGKYMCPYTQDKVLADWVDKAIHASAGATVGSLAGAYAGQQALKQVPFIGGFLGAKLGEKIGREIAIKAAGGWQHVKDTSDMSFNSIDDMAVYLYVNHSSHEHYQAGIKATMNVYPELKTRYTRALMSAPRKQ